MPQTPAAIIRDLVDTLEGDETLVPEVARVIRETVPGYENVPESSLHASIGRNLGLTFRTILAGRAPDPEEIDEAEELALERMAQGVSIGSVLAGFRICMRVILGRLLDIAPGQGLPAEEVLAFSTQLWALGDSFSTRAVVVHQERSIAQAVADSSRRAHWIREAVLTGLAPTELRAGAAAFGVPTEAPLRALRAEGAGTTDALLSRLERWAERSGCAVHAAPHGDAVLGILVGRPLPEFAQVTGPSEPAEAGRGLLVSTTVALGEPGPLEELPASFAGATRVLETAHRVGRTGVVDLEGMSWRMGIGASPETTALLRERVIAPVRAEGEFSVFLLEAVRAYLGHGLSIPRAAAAIPVHVNTLRYRLKRFRELTGTDLHEPEDLIEVAWALAAEAGDDRDGSPPSGPPLS